MRQELAATSISGDVSCIECGELVSGPATGWKAYLSGGFEDEPVEVIVSAQSARSASSEPAPRRSAPFGGRHGGLAGAAPSSRPHRAVVAPRLIGVLARNGDPPRLAAGPASDGSLETDVADPTDDRCARVGPELNWLAPSPPPREAPQHARCRSSSDFARDRESAPAPRLRALSPAQCA
jgi:hypothetical protein